MRRAFLIVAGLLFVGGGSQASAQLGRVAMQPLASTAPSAATVVFLVRHAEKVDDSRDPELSERGVSRADVLRRTLSGAGITAIWTTDYKRTRNTAAPLASETGLETMIYDPGNLAGFAAKLLSSPGVHVVVGHSNTTPDLVKALGGEAGGTIPDSEYDRLYALVIREGQVTTIRLRYGAPSP